MLTITNKRSSEKKLQITMNMKRCVRRLENVFGREIRLQVNYK